MKQQFVLILFSFVAMYGMAQDKVFTTETESLQHYHIPEWYKDAKLGYWCTWGLYSVPAYAGDHAAEWYGRWMYTVDDGSGREKGKTYERRGLKTAAYHRQHFGDPSVFGYKDFIPMFQAEKFDANEWAKIFAEGGAKFFMFMGMHHDNFCLWDSENQPFNSVKMGPRRDFVAEMKAATLAHGMKFGLSNHSAWNGQFFEYNHINGFDALAKENQALYGTGKVDSAAVERWWRITIEMADKYQPDLYYFDWGWNMNAFTEQVRRQFLAHYYNKAIAWGKGEYPCPNVAVNYKNREKLPLGSAVLDLERGGMKGVEKYLWQNDTSLGLKSWSYAPDEEYRTANQVVDMLMDIISKNGVLLLNVGPKADGSIPQEALLPIKKIGEWLKVNGEAVYATRPWQIFGEGPTVPDEKMHGDQVEYVAEDIRFTRNKANNILYVTFLGLPTKANVSSLAKLPLENLRAVTALSSGKKVKYKQNEKGLCFKLNNTSDKEDYAYVVKLEFEGQIPNFR